MRHRPSVFALVVVAGATIGLGPQTAPFRPAIADRLDALFTGLHDRGLFDGAVVVGTPLEVIWQKGFGSANREAGVAFTPETPTDGGSLAKTFTATLLLMLERDGTLDLDDPAARFVPEMPYPDVTLRHLLSHSSGMPVLDYDFFDPLIAAGEVRTTERLVRALAAAPRPLVSKAGARFEYSSFGFDIAALAGARAAGTPLPQLLAERLFRPLGIGSALLRPGRLADFPGTRTLGYRRADGRIQPHDVFDFEAFHGGSNIYLSVRDLHRWNVAFLEPSALDAGVVRAALEPARIAGDRSGLTLGSWYTGADRTTEWYSGHLQGFHSEVFRDRRSRRSIVYTSNNTLEPWLQKSVVRAIAAIQDGKAPPALAPPAVIDLGATDYPRLTGLWTMTGGGTVEIRAEGKSVAMARDGVSYRMVQVSANTFYVPGLDFMIGFGTGADGRVSRMHVSTNLTESWERRVK